GVFSTPRGPGRIAPRGRPPLRGVVSPPLASSPRTSKTSASPLFSGPRPHCVMRRAPAGPLASSLYTSERTARLNAPPAPLFAQVGSIVVDGGCAQTSAPATTAPASSRTVPVMNDRGSRRTATVASPPIASTGRRSGARRWPGSGVTRIVYVAARTTSDAAPAGPDSVQRSSPDVGAAQTAAPGTGVPSCRLTSTLIACWGVGVATRGGGGGGASHPAS